MMTTKLDSDKMERPPYLDNTWKFTRDDYSEGTYLWEGFEIAEAERLYALWLEGEVSRKDAEIAELKAKLKDRGQDVDSKPPLVVGQRCAQADLPDGAVYRYLQGSTRATHVKRRDYNGTALVEIVSLPSAEADSKPPQFKKCSACNGSRVVPGANEYTTEACRECFDGHVPVSPDSALTDAQRREVDERIENYLAEQIKLVVEGRRLRMVIGGAYGPEASCADILRAALAKGGA